MLCPLRDVRNPTAAQPPQWCAATAAGLPDSARRLGWGCSWPQLAQHGTTSRARDFNCNIPVTDTLPKSVLYTFLSTTGICRMCGETIGGGLHHWRTSADAMQSAWWQGTRFLTLRSLTNLCAAVIQPGSTVSALRSSVSCHWAGHAACSGAGCWEAC